VDGSFNRAYHIRSLNVSKIEEYFSDFTILNSFEFASGKRGYNKMLPNIKHRLVPASVSIPKYWIRYSSRETMCPKCETTFI